MTTLRCITGSQVDRSLRRRLEPLTNDGSRGDHRDDGTPGRSSMARWLRSGDRQDSWLVLAEGDLGQPVGWALVRRTDANPGNDAQVDAYVGPAIRRQGLGRWLLAEAERLARSLRFARLQVRPWNSASVRFYANTGFITVLEPGAVDRAGLAEMRL